MSSNRNKITPGGMVVLCGFLTGLCVIFYAARSGEPIPAFIGTGLVVLSPIAGEIVQSVKNKEKLRIEHGVSTKSSKKNAAKYLPLLSDERTKQHPEIQRLLQYLEVQKAFFDPSYIQTAQAQSEPNVQELMEVFDKIIAWQETNGTAPLPNGGTPLGSFDPFAQQRRRDEQSKPRKVVGAILAIVGLLTFISPFFGGKNAEQLFILTPFGMLLIGVGSLMLKK